MSVLDKNKEIDLQIKIVNKVFGVSINILILLFIYISLIGDVGVFVGECYLKNNIKLNEIILFLLGPSIILYIVFLGANCMDTGKLRFSLFEFLSINFFLLAEFNYIVYFFETKDYKGFVIIGLILLFFIIRNLVKTFLYKKINNKEI